MTYNHALSFEPSALSRFIRAPLLLVGIDGSIRHASLTAARELGHSAEAIIGRRLPELCTDPAAVEAYLRSCARTSGPTPGALPLGREGRRVRCDGILVRDSAGARVLGISLKPAAKENFVLLGQKIEQLNHEVDRRRRIQITMSRIQRLTAALVGARDAREVASIAVEQGLQIAGAHGAALFLSSNAGDSLELVAHAGNPGPFPERVPESADGPIAEAFRSGERRLATLDAQRILYAEPLVTASTRLGVLSFAHDHRGPLGAGDVTLLGTLSDQCAVALERARLFDAERAARHDATLAERRKDEFLAVLGHELRNPLAPIKTALDLMRLRDRDTFAKERAVIERQTHHLTTLVDDLLDVSRIARGKVDLHLEPQELARTIERAVEMTESLFEERNIELRVSVPDRGLALVADHHRVAQIVSNLLNNAAKYTEPGGWVELRAARDGDSAVVRVRDSGIGIEPAVLPHIFDMFAQDNKRGSGGLGLGLSIVRNLAQLHGGRAWATSEGLGKGSEFIVHIPGACERAEALESERAAARPAGTGAGVRVLIVDDNEDAADLLAVGLASEGYQAHAVPDGPSALRAIEERSFDVALLDIGLPIMDGYELARRLRDRPESRSIPLIAVTAYGQSRDRERSLEAGFRAHVVKPVSIQTVSERILEAVR